MTLGLRVEPFRPVRAPAGAHGGVEHIPGRGRESRFSTVLKFAKSFEDWGQMLRPSALAHPAPSGSW